MSKSSVDFNDLKMNRLILVGNGFDRAHNMETSYMHFLMWYLKESFLFAEKNGKFKDELIEVTRMHSRRKFIDQFKNLADYTQFMDFGKELNAAILGYFTDYVPRHEDEKGFKAKFISPFMKDLISHCAAKNWVDIENKYYEHLKKHLELKQDAEKKLTELNLAFNHLIKKLIEYLSTIRPKALIDELPRILTGTIKGNDLVTLDFKDKELLPTETMIVNFNYTETVNEYYAESTRPLYPVKNVSINHIHGRLNDQENNPIIFGFGDELDDSYKLMENDTRKGFLSFIKSFWYFKTSHYHALIRFIQSEYYQVYILGHSCGLSDRTMLHMVFEHENCKSIKIFPHVHNGYDNYSELTQEISRHFTDKGVMRMKIVPRDKSEPMPQLPIPKN